SPWWARKNGNSGWRASANCSRPPKCASSIARKILRPARGLQKGLFKQTPSEVRGVTTCARIRSAAVLGCEFKHRLGACSIYWRRDAARTRRRDARAAEAHSALLEA